MSDPPTTRAAVAAWGDGGAPPPASVMPTALALLIAAIGRCRYCHGSGERCTACRNALATLEAAFRAASPIPYATRRARATAPPVRDTGHPWARP